MTFLPKSGKGRPLAKSGKDFHTLIKEIAALVDGPISAEVTAMESAGMIEEGMVLDVVMKQSPTADFDADAVRFM